MKKDYAKPYAKKVLFAYEDQVMAMSGGEGTLNNRDQTDKCQFRTWGVCNKYWTPAGAIATYGLTDCTEFPSD